MVGGSIDACICRIDAGVAILAAHHADGVLPSPLIMMRQLILGLDAPKPPSLASFVVGGNAELTSLVDQLGAAQASGIRLPLDRRFVYFWGQASAGKSHLLQALSAAPHTRRINGAAHARDDDLDDAFYFDPAISLYLIDDADRLGPQAQVAAFALFNQVREHGATLVSAGCLPPALLRLREDLRTRLGWGLVYHLHELSDAEKIEALTMAAQARGMALSPGVLPYLITHFQRDMRSLSAMLDALDRHSLETQRPITLPLLRNLLQREGEPPA